MLGKIQQKFHNSLKKNTFEKFQKKYGYFILYKYSHNKITALFIGKIQTYQARKGVNSIKPYDNTQFILRISKE